MWFSWRPRKNLALVESADGIRWSDPVIVLGPNRATTWEADIDPPVVVRRADGDHLWYTGQTEDRGQGRWFGVGNPYSAFVGRRVESSPFIASRMRRGLAGLMVLWEGLRGFRLSGNFTKIS